MRTGIPCLGKAVRYATSTGKRFCSGVAGSQQQSPKITSKQIEGGRGHNHNAVQSRNNSP